LKPSEEPKTNSQEGKDNINFRQKIVVSNKWGFTSLTRLEYQRRLAEGTIKPDGVNIRLINKKGPLAKSPLF
jgi:hypothetical protein